MCLSYSRCSILLLFGGITIFMLWAIAYANNSSVSCALSANKCSASNPSIKSLPYLQSAQEPAVTITLTGIPCASTAKCILVLSPLWYGSCPDSRRVRLPHGDAPCNSSHLSETTRNRGQRSSAPGGLPKYPGHANGKSVGGCSSSHHSPAVNPATVHRCGVSRRLH